MTTFLFVFAAKRSGTAAYADLGKTDFGAWTVVAGTSWGGRCLRNGRLSGTWGDERSAGSFRMSGCGGLFGGACGRDRKSYLRDL